MQERERESARERERDVNELEKMGRGGWCGVRLGRSVDRKQCSIQMPDGEARTGRHEVCEANKFMQTDSLHSSNRVSVRCNRLAEVSSSCCSYDNIVLSLAETTSPGKANTPC